VLPPGLEKLPDLVTDTLLSLPLGADSLLHQVAALLDPEDDEPNMRLQKFVGANGYVMYLGEAYIAAFSSR